ncbi:MAG: hypothetical protein ACBR12_20570 [Microcoleus sp.]
MIHFYLLNPRMCQLGVRNVGLNNLLWAIESSEQKASNVHSQG